MVFLFLMIAAASSGCGPTGKGECKKPLNPNGDSELALLMRQMATATEAWKTEVKSGKLSTTLDISTLKTATPTDGTVSGNSFNGFADAYTASVNNFLKPDSVSVYRFNLMVDQCMNCHSNFCPGPMKRIEKMYVK